MPRGYFQDHTGCVYGRLTVLEHLGYGRWLCQCECGNTVVKRGSLLDQGKALSCGCLARETAAKRSLEAHSLERLYHVWQSMKSRCYNKNNQSYGRYGERGISVCDEWKTDYNAFKKWAFENGYDPDAQFGECTLDRIDVDGNYEPSNCRWVSIQVQNTNKHERQDVNLLRCRPVEMLDSDGNTRMRFYSVSQAAAFFKVSSAVVSNWCKYGRTRYGLAFKYGEKNVQIDTSKCSWKRDLRQQFMSLGIEPAECDGITYAGTDMKVKIGDIIAFVDRQNEVGVGQVFGYSYGLDDGKAVDYAITAITLDNELIHGIKLERMNYIA